MDCTRAQNHVFIPTEGLFMILCFVHVAISAAKLKQLWNWKELSSYCRISQKVQIVGGRSIRAPQYEDIKLWKRTFKGGVILVGLLIWAVLYVCGSMVFELLSVPNSNPAAAGSTKCWCVICVNKTATMRYTVKWMVLEALEYVK